jgi:MFS family permease
MPLPEKKLKKALNNSLRDGASYSVMDGITNTYSTPFALSLGASNTEIGILNSAPSLLMTIFQLLTGRYIDKLGRKRVAVTMGLLQKLMWVPIILLPMLYQQGGLWPFIILFSLSGTVISVANTAWSSWIGCIVPEKIRGSFFGNRTMIQSAFSFVATLGAGYILGALNSQIGFPVIFFFAFVSGMISYFYLRMIPEPICKHKIERERLDIFGLLKDRKRYRNFLPFTAHMSLVNFAVSLSSPFFTVYMLSNMGVGYEWYAIIVAAEVAMRIAMMRYWGKLSDRFGDRNVMAICNILIVFYPFLFLLCRNPYDLILVGIFSGFAWSGFDLTTFNYLLDVTPEDRRPSYISRYKVFIGIALFLGPLAGGFLSQYFTSNPVMNLNGLQALFLISFVLRFLATAFGLPKLREARIKRTIPVTDVFLKAFAVYPIKGMTHEIVYVQHRFEREERRIGTRGKRLERKVGRTLKEIYMPGAED